MTALEKQLLETAREAARRGGAILLEGFKPLHASQVSLKGFGDYVTDLDHASERAIIDTIRSRFPDHGIRAEESGSDPGSEGEWVIDPLDGTANYVQGIPFFGVSVAFIRAGEIVAGIVLDPLRNESFEAVRGGGAFLNGAPIRVSEKTDLGRAMVATGFPWRSKPYLNDYLDSFRALFGHVAGARRLGAACLDLAYTACGRFDGFWEMQLKPWDIAAGILLVREAGGVVTDFQGTDGYMESGNVVAATPAVHSAMVEQTQRTLSRVPRGHQ